jgi:tetratricopeptide (TPR) repeat protein
MVNFASRNMKTIQEIKEMLSRSEGQEALEAANEIVENKSVSGETLANAYYLRGNAYRQQGNVRMALNSYLESMDLDPDGPAAEAYRHIQELLDFYNKDYYNP